MDLEHEHFEFVLNKAIFFYRKTNSIEFRKGDRFAISKSHQSPAKLNETRPQ